MSALLVLLLFITGALAGAALAMGWAVWRLGKAMREARR